MTADDETSALDRDNERRAVGRLPAKRRGRRRPTGMRERLQDVNILLDVTRRISGTEFA